MTSIPHRLSDKTSACAFGDDERESFKRPRTVYDDISDANSTLSNQAKWFIMSIDSSQYNPDYQYIISPSIFELGQIFEIRQIIPLFFEKSQQSTRDASLTVDNHLFSLETDVQRLGCFYSTSIPVASLPVASLGESFDRQNYNAFMPLQHITEYLERVCKDGYICTNIDPVEEAEAEEQCKHYWWALPLLPKQESYHFHVTPYPQRNYMSINKFTVALAFILEGYYFEIDEGVFRLLTKQIEPSKQTVYYYQWHRTSLDDRFEEPILQQAPTQVPAKTNQVQGSLTRYKREEWWE